MLMFHQENKKEGQYQKAKQNRDIITFLFSFGVITLYLFQDVS